MLNLLHNFSHVGVYSCRVCLSESFFVSAVDLIRFDDICSFVYHLGLREYTVGFLNCGPVLDCQTWVHTVGSLQISWWQRRTMQVFRVTSAVISSSAFIYRLANDSHLFFVDPTADGRTWVIHHHESSFCLMMRYQINEVDLHCLPPLTTLWTGTTQRWQWWS